MTSTGSVPSPRRPRGPQRSGPEELVLLAQAVDVLAVRVAVSGELASGVRPRALGLHLAAASGALRDHAAVQRDVVLPVLGADEDALVTLCASADRVLAAADAVGSGAAALLEQTAGVRVLQQLGIATRTLWAAAIDHERTWGAHAAPRARQLLLERRRATSAGARG